ncbi:protein yellow-like [Chrysoperla carnea]|uniref:protein yellow-like n=1 Tax=Chrysoperla carnea TaxID=189513 RepID=UPI001D06A083|nr:protein yellow-like [Chrysoperla carnea]
MLGKFFNIIYLLLLSTYVANAVTKLREKFLWNAVNFEYPDRQTWLHALSVGDFIPENNLPVGIEVYNEKLFVTVPRWRAGIPSTLNYVPIDSPDLSPRLIPYPNWQANKAGDCENGLTTVYRIKVDECDRLWVLDTGTTGIGNTTQNPCPYALNVFDLKTDTRIRRYVFRPEDTNANTFIANIAVDIGATCDDAYAYFSDELGYGLIAYSWLENTSWRFTHSFFMPDPLSGDFNIAGLNFQWGEEGIFGMALSPIQPDGYRTMFFNPLASGHEFSVSTRILRNKTAVEDSYHDFKVVGTRGKDGHVTAAVMDKNGVLFYNLVSRNSIGCWNSRLPYTPENLDVVDSDDVGLVFPSDVKIDRNENIWVMSDRMPVFLIANLDFRDVNFRVYTTTVSEVLANTACAQPSLNSLDGYGALGSPKFYSFPISAKPALPKFIGYDVAPVKSILPKYAGYDVSPKLPSYNIGGSKTGYRNEPTAFSYSYVTI